MIRRRVLVSGTVQGVFFRQQTAERAEREGCAGWVRNLPDGRVEAVFEGPEESVGLLVAWAREGPPWARVTSVDSAEEDPEGLEGFEIRP